ncbi:MAG: sugar ABC transporter permease [Gorillibacterium sp.]|nr:sugar ABC transporter permease [Gorillibacterium sp.]
MQQTKPQLLNKKRASNYWKRTWRYHLMLLPAVVFILIFAYVPMGGIIMAFQDYKPWLGIFKSKWVGWDNFQTMFQRPDSQQVIVNTIVIASLKMTFGLFVPIVFSVFLNEVRHVFFKRVIQTLVYLPHFLSWVILGGILIDILSVNSGLINQLITSVFHIEPILFLGDNNWFLFTVILTDIWKEFGFSTIVFLAALTSINPSLYEAAEVDGATRWKQTLYITLPSLLPITVVVGTLSLGNILNAGFDQIFNLYNPLVYQKGDIIDTFVYRISILNGKMGFGTAVGLFKSFVGTILIVTAYRIAYKVANYKIF